MVQRDKGLWWEPLLPADTSCRHGYHSCLIHVCAQKMSPLLLTMIYWFDWTGFITPDDGSADLFVHQSNILADGFRSLADGEPVEFTVETSDDGRAKAVEVTGCVAAPNCSFDLHLPCHRSAHADIPM